jgi:heptosyltransferase-1
MTRLLVVRLSALGDVVHTIPAVVGLRGRYDEVAWAVEPAYRELVEIVAGVRAIPVSLKRWSLEKIAEARRSVRGFDAAIDFQGLIKSSLLARASGAPLRYGFAAPFVREAPASWFVNRPVTIDASRHVVEWNLQLAGVGMPEVDFSPFALGAGETGAVVLLPGAGRPEKQWPAERWREVARALAPRALVLWGPGEEALAQAAGGRMAPPTSLRSLAAFLRDAALVVGGDTGPLHLAAALGTPVIGLYGPTDPRRNGPYGQLGRCLSTFATSKSMMEIETREVLARIEEVLAS